MPGNFFYVGLIRLILPNARIIHTVRDPVDTCVSCFSRLFTSGLPFSYDLAELGRYYREYHELMAHWRSVLPAGAMLDVAYEDVVDDLEAASPAADRLLRSSLGRSLSEFPRNQPADRHRQQRAGPPAALSQFGRALAALRSLSRAAAGRARRLPAAAIKPLPAAGQQALDAPGAPVHCDSWPPGYKAIIDRRDGRQQRGESPMTTSSQTPESKPSSTLSLPWRLREHGAGRLDEAAAAYHKILALHPDSADTYNNLGIVLKQQGQLDQAVVSFERCSLSSRITPRPTTISASR